MLPFNMNYHKFVVNYQKFRFRKELKTREERKIRPAKTVTATKIREIRAIRVQNNDTMVLLATDTGFYH